MGRETPHTAEHGPASRFAPLRTVSAVVVLSSIAFIAAAPAPDHVQVLLCIATIATYFLMSWLRPSGGPFRTFVALLIVFTSTRYMIWRVTETMPSDSVLSIIGGIFLLGAETYGYILLLLSTFLSVDVYKRQPRPAPLSASACPTVDILIPSYNEPDDLLEVTLTAALNVNYPAGRVKVYLLDDGGTEGKRNQADPKKAAEAQARHDHLKEVCTRLGAHYLTREKNNHAKAGNINAALQKTDGELITHPRRGPRSVHGYPDAHRGLFHRGPETLPRPDPALLPQPGSAGTQPRHVPQDAERERDVLLRHPTRAGRSERRLLLRIGRVAPAKIHHGNRRHPG